MFCLIGLGNPGRQYLQTRHNAGFLVIDRIADLAQIALEKEGFQSIYGKGILSNQTVILVKPQTFMNLSGEAVRQIVNHYRISLDRVLVIYDDLDLPLGSIRIRLSGSAGGHNGLTSVLTLMGTQKIPRMRVGIGRPANEPVVDYVLSSFSGQEMELFKESIERAARAGISYVSDGPEYAMNHFNRNLTVNGKNDNQSLLT